MSEATMEQRREAVAEIRKEILGLLERIVEELSTPPPVIRPAWENKRISPDDLDRMRRLAAEEAKAPSTITFTSGPKSAKFIPIPFLQQFNCLLWLLGLSETERSFVESAAQDSTANKPDYDAYSGLSVFADWLEDQGREKDGATIRRLIPQAGDLLVVTVPRDAGPLAVSRAYEEVARPIKEALARLGKEVVASAVREGNEPRIPSAEEMQRLGWMKVSDHYIVFQFLRQSLTGEPEEREAGMTSTQVVKLIDRLKRESAELRRAVANEREACAVAAEKVGQITVGRITYTEYSIAEECAEAIRRRGQS